MLEFEKLGTPTVSLVSSEFAGLARAAAQGFGAADFPMVIVPHPFGGIPKSEVQAKADARVDDIIQTAISWQPKSTSLAATKGYYPANTIKIHGTTDDVNAFFFKQGWSDGLPIVPPTREKVDAMLAATSYAPDTLLLKAPPRMGGVTVETVAINAVMAGCRTEYMPVLVSAFELLGKEYAKGWDLLQIQTTTNPVSIIVIVSGPIAKEIGVQSGTGLLGPGWHANATIGRAFKMILDIVGGSLPPSPDKSTHGQSGDFTMCMAESDDNPWEPLRVQMGFSKDDNVVILFPMFQRKNVNDHWNTTGKGILTTTAAEMATVECPLLRDAGMMVVFGPEHAATISKDQWDLKNVRRFLYEWGRVPFSRFIPGGGGWPAIPKWIANAPEADCKVPVVERPEDILVAVAGGPGKHSMIFVGGYAKAIAGLITK